MLNSDRLSADPSVRAPDGVPARIVGFVARTIEGDALPRLNIGPRFIAVLVGISMSVFHIVVLGFYAVDPWVLTCVHLTFASILIVLLIPASGTPTDASLERNRFGISDAVLVLIALTVAAYILMDYRDLYDRSGVDPTNWDVVIGVGLLILVLETTRRTAGIGLPVLAGIFVLYGLFGDHIPGALGHNGFSFKREISFLLSPDGVYGVALNASAQYVFLFVLFGALLGASGGIDLFIDVAVAAVARFRGGPAKVSMLSSILFGTVSGSSVANVAVEGVVCIPMMKAAGIPSARAAAIAACNSIGGQFVPPVMGIAAFLMADFLGVPYSKIMIAGIIPAALYYLASYLTIDFMAARSGVKGITSNKRIGDVLRSKGHLVLPLFAVVYGLGIEGVSPIRAALYGMASLLIASWLRRDSRIDLARGFNALYQGAERAISIVPTCATAGIIVGIFMLTGLGVKATTIVLTYSFGSPSLALLIVMLIILILGMGMPTVAAYAIGAVVAVPALTKLGIPILAAHFFIFYFAVLSGITPPVALAAFTAAAIAKAPLNATGYYAVRQGLSGFVIPFVFVSTPGVLMQSSWLDTVAGLVAASIAVLSIAAAIEGWLLGRLSAWQRGTLAVAAVSITSPIWGGDAVGIALFLTVFIWHLFQRRAATPAAETSIG